METKSKLSRTVLWNAWVDGIALILFAGMASSGFVLRWKLAPGSGGLFGRGMGRGAQERSVDLLWGLTRHEWGAVHFWLSIALLAVLSIHVALHWRWITCVVRGRQTEASGRRLAVGLIALALLIAASAAPLLSRVDTMKRRELWELRGVAPGGAQGGRLVSACLPRRGRSLMRGRVRRATAGPGRGRHGVAAARERCLMPEE